MLLKTTLPILIADLQHDALALAEQMISLTIEPGALQSDDSPVPNVLASSWVLRIVFISECLAEMSAAIGHGGTAEARQVAARHRQLLDQADLSRRLPALEGLRPVARQQLGIERRYDWLCSRLAEGKMAAIAA